MKKSKGVKLALAFVLIFGIILAGCSTKAPIAPSAEPSSTKAPIAPSAESNVKGSGEAVSLMLWDNFTDDTSSKIYEELIADFNKETPNITVKRTKMTGDNIRSTIKPALTSGNGPDLFNYDAGPGYLGVLAKSELALDLTEYAKQYGWTDRFPKWINERTTIDGKYYGIGNEVELLGVYYNKKIFADLGVKVPTTYEQFLEIAQKVKDKGLIPISFDDKDQWPGFHLESVFYNAVAGKEKVDAVLQKKESFDQPIFAEALDQFYALIKKGYLSPNPLSVSYDDGNKEFFSGKAAMRITGTWMVADMYKNLKENVGFFLMPSVKPELPLSAPGGIGGVLVGSAKSKHPDEVAKFLDFMFSEKNAKIWYSYDRIPPLDIDINSLDVPQLFKEVVQMANNQNGLGFNVDVMMPQKVNNVTQNIMQELIAGKKTGAQIVKEKEKALEEEIKAGNY